MEIFKQLVCLEFLCTLHSNTYAICTLFFIFHLFLALLYIVNRSFFFRNLHGYQVNVVYLSLSHRIFIAFWALCVKNILLYLHIHRSIYLGVELFDVSEVELCTSNHTDCIWEDSGLTYLYVLSRDIRYITDSERYSCKS